MISIFYGTRPEYIKLYNLYKNINKNNFPVELVKINQHTNLIDDCYFDRQINLNDNTNRLNSIVQSTLDNLVFRKECSLCIVQGDTATAFGIAMNAFNSKIPVAHIEAGLRTFDIDNPFPEETYRRCISVFAKYHFCATEMNRNNLINEKISKNIFVVGNTSLDNLIEIKSSYGNEVLITLHRRENKNLMEKWFIELEKIAIENKHLKFIFPMHPNPDVMKHRYILNNINVIDPLSHSETINLISRCKFIITDSGGIQEEASFLNKKTIVCRTHTERSEGLGTFSFLCVKPNDLNRIVNFIDNDYEINQVCPYGDGFAVQKITNIIKEIYYDKNIQ